MKYDEFIESKLVKYQSTGFEVDVSDLNPLLFEWQKQIVRWALAKGKAAIFADCGLGKTIMQLEWAHRVHLQTGKPVLIIAPLAVSKQTKREGVKFGIDVNICLSQFDVINSVNITNYERLDKFDGNVWGGICLDESSILKHSTSKTRKLLTDIFRNTPYKLCCTATPAPNDFMELDCEVV